MPTRTYVFIIEKPDDSYEQRIEALSLADAREMMHQESRRQPDWLSYRLIDTIDHDDEEEEEEEDEGGPELRQCPYCYQMHQPEHIEQCPLKPRQDATEYNRRMDERNRIIRESVDKPWLPLHDGE